jgi:Ca2+-binding RTX toxin-like protein
LEGNDNVYGSDGSDTLNGGSGDDYLTGGDGADTYLISKTDGADSIYNYDNDGSIDTVKFTDLKSTELTALYDDGSGNLILKYGTAGNQLKIYGFFGDYANAKVDQFTFTDKTITADTIITTRHNGTDANDYLYGLAGKTNTLNGLDGNDYLNGAELTDTLNGGNGSDQLYGNQGADVLNGDSGDDYNSNFGNFGYGGLFGGDGNDIINGGLGIDYLSGDAGNDILNGGDGNDDVYFFDSSTGIEYFGGLFGGEGNDILNGNAGNDYLEGGEGADTYGFALGDGADWINNSHSDTSIDVVKFSNVASSAVTSITRSGDELVIGYGSADVLTVASFFTGTTYAIGSFQFSDGVTLNSFIIGSTANDSLNGTSLNDAISGLAGADSMSGGLGNDLYFVDNTGDVVTEASNAGIDTVLSTINYTLTASVENLALQGNAQTATGNSGQIP